MKYGEKPIELGIHEIECQEMMFYQYLPIKLAGEAFTQYEGRLKCFKNIIRYVYLNYIDSFGFSEYRNSYMYLTAKHLYQLPQTSFNRMGYHSDGFLTEDINYIWSDKFPTIFNKGEFNLTSDDILSMKEMEEQAKIENEVTYPDKTLLRLNQYNIHKVGNVTEGGMRLFLKISFSKDKYDLIGNNHNYELNYNWDMKPRSSERNIPQTKITI